MIRQIRQLIFKIRFSHRIRKEFQNFRQKCKPKERSISFIYLGTFIRFRGTYFILIFQHAAIFPLQQTKSIIKCVVGQSSFPSCLCPRSSSFSGCQIQRAWIFLKGDYNPRSNVAAQHVQASSLFSIRKRTVNLFPERKYAPGNAMRDLTTC